MGFVYLWRDQGRNMYYVGSHSGTADDGYISTSKWLNYEYAYRPQDFRRRILKVVDDKDLKQEEYRLIKMIKPQLFGKRYYNLRSGRQKGCEPWNKGRTDVYTEDRKRQMSEDRRSRDPWNKGGKNPQAAFNGKKAAAKLSRIATGRFRVYQDDGSWKWGYPETKKES